MGEPLVLDLTAAHRAIVIDILRAHAPKGTEVWVFGSRAKGKAKKYSDLDLAIDAGRRMTLDEMSILSEEFRESDLPWKVDLVDWRAIDGGFAQLIVAQRVELAWKKATGPRGVS